MSNPYAKDQYNLFYDLTHADKLDMIIMAEPMAAISIYWREEISRRYSDAVIVYAHGGPSYIDNEWACTNQQNGKVDTWASVVDRIRERHPYRRIVIISCNPWHQHLDRKYVTYARQAVWFFPDNLMYEPLGELFGQPGNVGNIFDFIEQ